MRKCNFCVTCVPILPMNAKKNVIIDFLDYRGVLPLGQRARLWEKHRARSRKQQRGHASTTPQDLQSGQSVTMKNAPMYQPGAVGKSLLL